MQMLASFFPKIDATSTQNAIKITLGFCIATSLALAFQWPKPYWASFTAMMLLNKPLLGNSIQNALGRIIASFVGAIVGLLLVTTFIQQQWLFTIAMCIWVFICSIMACHSNNSFTYVLASITAVIIALASLSNPALLSIYMAKYRLSEIFLGVLTGLTISSFLWPRQATKAFADSTQQLISECEQLVALMAEEYFQKRLARRYQLLENVSLQALDMLPEQLIAAKQESFHYGYHYKNYQYFIDSIYELVCHIHSLHEALLQDQNYLLLHQIPEETRYYFTTLQSLLAELKKIDITKPASFSMKSVYELENRLQQRIANRQFKSDKSLYDHAICLTIYRQMLECCQALRSINHAFHAIKKGKRLKRHTRHISSSYQTHWLQFKERFLKSIKVSLIVFFALTIWFYVNWPGGYSHVYIALLIGMFNLVLPIAIEEVLRAFAVAVVFAGIIYLFIFPHLQTLLGLNLACLLPIFYFSYLCANSQTNRLGVLSATFFIGLLNINVPQTYSFTIFTETAIGNFLAILLALFVICVLWPRQPEFRYVNNCKLFISKCREIIAYMQTHTPGDKNAQQRLLSLHKQLLSFAINIRKYRDFIEEKNHSELYLSQLDNISDDLQTLGFRMDTLINERAKVIYNQAFQLSAQPLSQLRNKILTQIDSWEQHIKDSHIPTANYHYENELKNITNIFTEIEFDTKSIPMKSIVSMLSVLNCYYSITNILVQIDKKIQLINWQQLIRIH